MRKMAETVGTVLPALTVRCAAVARISVVMVVVPAVEWPQTGVRVHETRRRVLAAGGPGVTHAAGIDVKACPTGRRRPQ